MLEIKISTVLKLKLNGLHENVQDFYSRWLGSRENTENKVWTVLLDTLYNKTNSQKFKFTGRDGEITLQEYS